MLSTRRLAPLLGTALLATACAQCGRAVATSAPAGGPGAPQHGAPRPTHGQMQDYADFDFTEEEIYRGLRLAVPDAEARRQAREAAAALGPGMDWATSEHLLLLLSLGSESAAAKVERIRRSEQEGRRSTWEAAERAAGRGDLARRWAELVAGEDRAWSERREALRRSLRAEGKLPP